MRLKTKIENAVFGMKELPLDWQDCRLLQHIYSNIMTDTTLLMDYSEKLRMPIAEVYYECKIANKMLGDRIKRFEMEALKIRKGSE